MTFDLRMWPLTSTNEGSHVAPMTLVWFQWDFNCSIEASFTFSTYLTTWPHMTFGLGMWPLTSSTNEGTMWHLWLKFGSIEAKCTWLSYNLTSYDLWPWYVTYDLINKCGFLCCTYDPSLVEIHQSMRKVEANVNPFSQQTTTTTVDKVIPICLSCYAGDTKMMKYIEDEI